MELTGLEPRRSDLARGIVIARSSKPLNIAAQRALWVALSDAGVTEPEDRSDKDSSEPGDEEDIERQWLAAPWLPPTPSELEAQRASFAAAAEQFGLEAIWCVKVETGIDGLGWRELTASEPGDPTDDDEEDDDDETDVPPDVVATVLDDNAEVIYSAPDAPPNAVVIPEATEDDADADDDDEDDILGDDIGVDMESHWRNGTPPLEHSVLFPIERYPEIIDEFDWDNFGVAFKLSGPQFPGEESVVNAFFALWLSVFQDERTDEYEPFQRADVVHDRVHRSALMWAERMVIPATAADQVHFLLWIIARINEIVPLSWARFETVDDSIKSRAITDDESASFILAGNPFAERYRRNGEESALQWAVGQSAWSRRELAGMLIEVALEHDPDLPASALIAERLLRRALAFDAQSDANGYLGIVLVRQRRLEDAITLARAAHRSDVRLLVVGETAEHAPEELGPALVLLDADTLAETEAEEIADLVGSIARHAPDHLAAVLELLPEEGELVPYLYNASFAVERPAALLILRRVLALPVPPRDAGEARTALVMAWNNACIHAHALDDYRLAVELADGGQPYGPENPYIYHSAACAYASVGELDRAIDQVKLAIEHDYEHGEKMETDTDLLPLQSDPRFTQLFVEWRARRADLN